MWGLEWVIAFVVICLIGLYILGTRNHDAFKKHNFPYIKGPLPFIGNFGSMVLQRKAFGETVNDFYKSHEGFKYFGFFDFNNVSVMIRDPETIKLITVKEFDHFEDRVTPVSEDVDSFFGKSLLSLRGQRWRDMRNLLSPTFTSSKIKAMFVLIEESGQQMVNYLDKRIKDEKSEILELDMKDFFTRFTNDVIATAAFGVTCDSLKNPNNEFYVAGKDATNFNGVIRGLIFAGFRVTPRLMKFLGFSIIPEKGKKFFQSVVSNSIALREREGIVRPDMIHLMMEARKETSTYEHTDEGGENKHRKKMDLSDEDITAQAFLFFLGGFDSSSSHMCFLAQLLAMHPDVQQRLQEEVDEVLAAEGGKLTYEGMQKMHYLDMCINETLRLWPPAPASNRECVKPYVLPATDNSPSFRVEKGMGAWIPIMAIHLDPKYFPDPERFDPERFSEENKHKIQPYTYMPFGTGPRNCIGMRFALMETKVALVSLLSRFDLVVTPKTSTKPRMARKSFNMTIEGGFWVGMKPRAKKTP